MASAGDEFDDEYFADLLGEDLDELERQAIKSTQPVQKHSPTAVASQSHAQPYATGEDLDVASFDEEGDQVFDAAGSAYVQGDPVNRGRPHISTTAHSGMGSTRAVPAGAASWQRNLPSAGTHLPLRLSSQEKATDASNEIRVTGGDVGSVDDVQALQAQVQELLLEREKLQLAVQDANRQVFTKSGEVAIVRANSERTAREREQKIANLEIELKRANEQRSAEQEQVRKQQEQVATESRFADHDRFVARTRPRKQVYRQDQDVVIAKPQVAHDVVHSTPRKSRHGVFGDGFNAQERSPVRSENLSRDATPTAAEKKRKRTLDSPLKADHGLHNEEDGDGSFVVFQESEDEFVNSRPVHDSPNRQYSVLRRFLDCRLGWDETRSIEVLAQFHLPSEQKPLSTMIYDAVSNLGSDLAQEAYAVGLVSIVVSLWSRCVTEKYYAPLTLLIDYIAKTLLDHPEAIGSLMDDIVPVAQTTGDVNIIPRFKRYRKATTGKPPNIQNISPDVSVSTCLELLVQIVSTIDMRDTASATRFWHLVRFDFVSMLLRPSQEPQDIALVADLLGYSAKLGSIGSIIDASNTNASQAQSNFNQAKSEDHLLDRLSSMLIELPRPIESESAMYLDESVCRMRLSILGCLGSFAMNRSVAKTVIEHPLVVGRLARCMADGFHCAMESSPNQEADLTLHLAVVSEAARLLYHFLNAHQGVDINVKLQKIPGGPQKYLVVLSRLVFSEGTLYGFEIGEDVLDCAQALLEDFVNPEEAEKLMEMAHDLE